MNKLRIVFMGTSDFAVESLKRLHEAGHNIVAVITAPDKPAGRGKKILSSPVKIYAHSEGLKILQPANLKSSDFLEELKELNADLQVVVAFRMLPEAVWAMPPKGTVNLHASLLPDYRGAAPINWVLINGEKETGVTTFFIEKEIDTGHVLLSEKVAIEPETNAGELHEKLMVIGAELLLKTIEAIAESSHNSISQEKLINGKVLHYAPKIIKENCRINWSASGQTIHNFIRGLSPSPAAWTKIAINGNDIVLKIFESVYELSEEKVEYGEIITDNKTFLKISVVDGYIAIKSLQLAGRNRMGTEEFLRGMPNLEFYRINDPDQTGF